MFSKKTLLTLALFFAVCSPLVVSAQEAREGRRAQNEGGYSFVFGGGNFLGVSVESVTRENMSGFNLRGGEPRGVAVRDVSENSPAAKAGLRKNDVILRFDGEAVSSVQKLLRLISESAPEHTARLSISRDGAEQELSVTLGRRENFAPQAFGNFNSPGGQLFGFNRNELKRNSEEWKRNSEEWKKRAQELDSNSQELRRNLEKFRAEGFDNNFALVYGGGGGRRIGITTQELTDQLADYFGVAADGGQRGGLLVTSVRENSPAAKAGLRAGDIVTEVEGTRLKTASELTRALNRRDEGDVTLQIKRDRKARTLKVTPERMTNRTLLTPGGTGFATPMALSTPLISVVPRPLIPAMPTMPALPALPRIAPVAPRPNAAPRIYAVPPVAPVRPGVWIL